MLLEADGSESTLIIRRLFCSRCNRTHHELPGVIVPYKRYSCEVIEGILSKKEELPSYPCETSSMLRIRLWFSLLRKYLEQVVEALKLLHKQDMPLLTVLAGFSPLNPSVLPSGWLKTLVRLTVNSGRWIQTRSA